MTQGATASARPAGDDRSWTVSGTAAYVIDGHTADLIVVPARTPGGLSLFAVRADAAGLTRTLLPTLDQTRKLARLEFSGAPARLLGPEGAAADAIDHARLVAVAALATEQAGVAEAAKEMAVALRQGPHPVRPAHRPVPGHQAQVRGPARGRGISEISRLRGRGGHHRESRRPGRDHRGGRSFCSEACLLAGHENIQIHGGIGFTWEHPAHLYYKRAKSSEFLFGDVQYHREILADDDRPREEHAARQH